MIETLPYSRRREHAIALRLAGRSRREIKAILGVGNSTLDAALRGVPPPEWTARPRAKDSARARARELRAAGATYAEIAVAVGASKGSVSRWVRELPPAEGSGAEERARRRADRAAGHLAAARERDEGQRRALSDEAAGWIGSLSEREILIAGAIAYWCEGAKNKPYRRTDRVIFINSDPSLVRFFLCFLDVAGVPANQLICRVHIHESADVGAAEQYWRDLTDLPADQFRRPTLKRHNPRTVRKNTGSGYYGCLVISVRRSMRLYRRIEGWAAAVMGAQRASSGS